MEAGAHVWCNDNDSDEAWLLAEVLKKSDEQLELSEIGKPENTFIRKRVSAKGDEPAELKYEGIELANAKLSEQDIAEGRDDDIITLPHLHEPALLHAIGERFHRGEIYTWTGPVLIAVNPFQRLPLYTREILETYRQEGLLRSQGMGDVNKVLGPHIYSIADKSYRQMMSEQRRSQSILISGESGAGKTEATKIVMLYLTTLGSPTKEGDAPGVEDMSVMERVLQSNPILEAFGNGKTLRNDNSSRFGKFIELGFSRSGTLLGAKVQTYLLEKVRLAFHASGERNYHIFYQVLRGASEDQKKRYDFHDGLTGGLELANYFHFTGQGGAPQLREFTDEEGLSYTVKAMKSMGWNDEKVDKVLAVTAGLLHLGQIQFNAEENEGGQEVAAVADIKTLNSAARLLGVDVDKLKVALTERILVTRGDAITIQLSPNKAMDARDSLAKTLYGALFLWVVDQVNICIGWEDDSEVRSSTGVLDIFGFECFAINSFEQLCINFTNEALQQQFNKFVFKMEQAEYESEEINWAFIAFPDNQDCLDTIQAKKTGILAILDDECRLPKGSDKNFAERLYKNFIPNTGQVESENTRFSAKPVQKSRSIFCVRHFAGVVQYTAVTGFMEKNKDEIPLTAKNLFETAPSELVRDVFACQVRETEGMNDTSKATTGRGATPKSKTVGQQFKEQLNNLMITVEKTEPHYIRCLKPNDAAKPNLLTRKRLTEQLRYGGVLEAVRVARMGYPVRLGHSAFYQRYRMLLPSVPDQILPWSMDEGDAQKLCIKLVAVLLEDGAKHSKALAEGVDMSPNVPGLSRAEKIRRMQRQPDPIVFPKSDTQLGLSKVFMRKPAHDALEAHRVFHQHASATFMQCWIKGMQQRRRFLLWSDAALMAQRWYRGCTGRARWWRLREAVASQLLTNNLRMQIHRKTYNCKRRGTVQLQAAYRGHATRRVLAAIKIQSMSRMCKRRSIYRHLKSATIALQCALRCKMAKKVLHSFKGEQKDIGKLKQNNEKLKLEMASLKAMLQAQAKGDANKKENAEAINAKQQIISKLEKRVAELEAQLEREKAIVQKLEQDMETQKKRTALQLELLQKQSEKMQKNLLLAAPASPKPNSAHSARSPKPASRTRGGAPLSPGANVVIQEVVNPELLAEHKAMVAQLEQDLEKERKFRNDADSEIIKLRAAMSGVNLNESDVAALLVSPSKTQDSVSQPHLEPMHESQESYSDSDDEDEGPPSLRKETAPELTGVEEEMEMKSINQPKLNGGVHRLGMSMPSFNEEKKEEKRRPMLARSASEYFPMIKRGFAGPADEAEQQESVMAVGWKVEVTTRKEREEALRDEVRQFEVKMKRFYSNLEEGIDVTMWQVNRNTELGPDEEDEFALKASPVTVKLQRRGELLLQAILAFSSRSGYLSKALGRSRGNKAALEPLSLHEILEVKAGCVGFDHSDLPAASGSKGKGKGKSGENKHSSLFLTLKASPTPVASSRAYILRFKSRSARNDLLIGLRGLLADLQIHEGVSISSMQASKALEQDKARSGRRMPGGSNSSTSTAYTIPMDEDEDILVPLFEVHNAIDKERETYDRLLLLMLQGSSDLKEKEDELLMLRGKLESVSSESAEKDRVQANDSKLIMQLSKKLETLLMDNEDLRDQNDRLNTRLVAVECEKMNLMQ